MTVKLQYGLLPLFLAFCFLLSAQSTTEQLFRADKQFELQAYNLALQSYQETLKTDASNAHATTRIAECLFQLNKVKESLDWYAKATSLPDVKNEALLGYGRTLMQAGDYLEAKKWFVFYSKHNRNVALQFMDACDYAMSNVVKEPLYAVTNEATNTKSSDFGPAFYLGNVVYSSARSDLKRKNTSGKDSQSWTGAANNQLFVSGINAKTGQLNKPEFLKSDLANNYNEGPLSFSADGKRVVFSRNNFVDGTRQLAEGNTNLSLYTAEVNNGKWEKVRAFPYNGSDYGTAYPALSSDGNTLYFASNRPNGFGGWDIYKSIWDGKTWAQPTNVGPVVNSPGNEITPYIGESTLYFSSDYHLGFGGLDVFSAAVTSNGYGPVVHLGPGLNSARDDYGFIYNQAANQGFVVSNRAGGQGNEDIYAVHKKTDDFEIIVTDLNNKPLAGAIIDFTACGGKESTTDENGIFNFSVSFGKANCTATVKKIGYESLSIKVASSASKLIKVSMAPVTEVVTAPVVYADTKVEAKPTPPATPAPLPKVEVPTMIGQVLNKNANTPLEKTVVVAVLTPSEAAYTVQSDVNGFYSLPVIAGQNYAISFTKSGFADAKVQYKSTDFKGMKVFPPAKLTDIETVLAEAKNEGGVTGSVSPVVYSNEKEVLTSKGEKSKVSPIMASIAEDEKTTFDGYAIQVAAIPASLGTDRLDKYKPLKNYGNVYTAKSGKLNKVRLGVFASEEEALAVLEKVKKEGHKDAFILEEKNSDNALLMTTPAAEVVVEAAPAPVTHSVASKSVATPVIESAKVPVLFAVQVAALSKSSALDLSSYATLSDIGNLYVTNEDGATKIRIGVWDDPEDASKAKSTIQSRGFKDAIIVTESKTEVGNLVKKDAPKAITSSKGAPAPVVYSTPTVAKPTPVKVVESPYKLRVATYQKFTNFDPKVVEGLGGTIETKKVGKSTVVYLSQFENLEAAIKAKNAVREKGFKDAHIVKEEDGKLVKMKL